MMKTFEEIYSELQSEDNVELKCLWTEIKQEKETAVRKALSMNLFIDSILAVLMIFIMINIENGIVFLLIFMWIGFIINFIIYKSQVNLIFTSKKYKILNKEYKNIIATTLLNNFYDGSEICINGTNKEDTNEYEKIYKIDGCGTFYIEEYFKARLDNKYDIYLAATMGSVNEDISLGNKKLSNGVGLIGLIQGVKMNHSINGEVRITMHPSIDSSNFDYTDFEKCFNVSSSENILSYSIVTSELMDKLLEFYRKIETKFDIYIKDDKIHIIIFTKDLFKIDPNAKELLDKESIKKSYNAVKYANVLSRELINVLNNV